MDERDRPQPAGESASLGGRSPLKPGQKPSDSVGEDREQVVSPANRADSEDYRQQKANAEQGAGGGDSTEGSREFIAGRGGGSGRKTGQGSSDDQGSPSAAADIESGEPASRQDARIDDASTAGR